MLSPGRHSSPRCPKRHMLLCLASSLPTAQMHEAGGSVLQAPQPRGSSATACRPQPHSVRFERSRERQRICVSAKFPGDAAAGRWPVFECPVHTQSRAAVPCSALLCG